MQTDQYTSLFLRDVSNSTGIPSFSSIAGMDVLYRLEYLEALTTLL